MLKTDALKCLTKQPRSCGSQEVSGEALKAKYCGTGFDSRVDLGFFWY